MNMEYPERTHRESKQNEAAVADNKGNKLTLQQITLFIQINTINYFIN